MHAHTSYSTIYRPVRHHAEPSGHVMQQTLAWNAQRVAAAGLGAGALLGGAAVASTSLKAGRLTLVPMLQWVTAGALGESAPISEEVAAVLGLFMHLVLSMAIAIGYGVLATRIPVARGSEVVMGLVYGAIVGIVMSALVLPVSYVRVDFSDANRVLLFIATHMLFVGIPIAVIFGSSQDR